jgi:type IV pilus assembly protein PilP
MGKNYGEILNISESSITLKEIIPNGSGGWVEREASLALTE